MNPLVSDLRSEGPLLKRFLLKGGLLLLLFVGLDRLAGAVLRAGLDRYYGLNQPAVVLCVGHSHTVLGIDKVALERDLGVPVAKFAVEGANTADRLMMIRYYFRRQPSSVRAVVYDVDAHTFTGSGLSSSSYQLLFPFIDDREIRAYIHSNCVSSAEYQLRRWLRLPRYNELTLSLAVRGYLKKWTNFKFGTVDVNRLAREVREGRFLRIEFDPANVAQFDSMTAFVCAEGKTLFLTYVPTIDVFNDAEPVKFKESVERLQSYTARNPRIVFLNYNDECQGKHDWFFDPIHLNREGQKEITARLAKDLKYFLEKEPLVEVATNHGQLD